MMCQVYLRRLVQHQEQWWGHGELRISVMEAWNLCRSSIVSILVRASMFEGFSTEEWCDTLLRLSQSLFLVIWTRLSERRRNPTAWALSACSSWFVGDSVCGSELLSSLITIIDGSSKNCAGLSNEGGLGNIWHSAKMCDQTSDKSDKTTKSAQTLIECAVCESWSLMPIFHPQVWTDANGSALTERCLNALDLWIRRVEADHATHVSHLSMADMQNLSPVMFGHLSLKDDACPRCGSGCTGTLERMDRASDESATIIRVCFSCCVTLRRKDKFWIVEA